MNRSFDPLDLVNTYGAFGNVDRERHEVILEGTRDAVPDASAHWEQYELPLHARATRGGDRASSRPTTIVSTGRCGSWATTPRAARQSRMSRGSCTSSGSSCEGEEGPRRLLARDPFPHEPPRWVRAGLWRYRFSDSRGDGAWWQRWRVGEYLRPLSVEDAGLREYITAYGWPDAPPGDGAP